MPSTTAKIYTFHERLGIAFAIEAACLSLAASTILLCYAGFKWIRRTISNRNRNLRASDASDSSLFLNLMFADLIQALGLLPSIKWMNDATITEGPLCTAQAVLKQVGINGVSFTSLAIALQTFAVLAFRWRAPRHATKFIIMFIWILDAVVVVADWAPNRDKGYYGNTGYWCWVEDEFKTEQIMSEYLWMWLAAILMTLLYGILFLVMRGIVVIGGDMAGERESEEDKKMKAIANLMLYYPAIYILCVLPNSLSRWLFFSHKNVPAGYALFASTLFSLSGFFNLLLFLVTRPEMVKGPSDSVYLESAEEVPIVAEHKGWNSESSRSPPRSSKFGHLPDLSGDAEQGHLPDVDEHDAFAGSGVYRRQSGSGYLPDDDDHNHALSARR